MLASARRACSEGLCNHRKSQTDQPSFAPISAKRFTVHKKE